ncbi:MAG: hypothetical protein IPH05_00025 [Flavobacteriales bacterium]|nr:hypothetical protein [Flavobacteriales bacterium]
MDVLLAQGKVDRTDIDRVLQVPIPFHRNAEIVRGTSAAAAILSDFADVAQIRTSVPLPWCRAGCGPDREHRLGESLPSRNKPR